MKHLKDVLALKNQRGLFVCYPDSKLLQIIDKMTLHNVHHIVIVERDTEKDINGIKSPGKVVGVISDRDMRMALNTPMLNKECTSLDQMFGDFIKQLDENRANQIMNSSVYCKHENTPVKEAIEAMKSQDISSIPVVQKGSRQFIGMVTRSDLLDLLLEYVEKDTSESVGTA
jgi:CBS domain-containing protein